jgi:hypothetical protein
VQVDPRPQSRLGVAADGEDVTAKARALRDVLHARTNPTRIRTARGTPRSELRIATAAITAAATTKIRMIGPVIWRSARPATTRCRHAGAALTATR